MRFLRTQPIRWYTRKLFCCLRTFCCCCIFLMLDLWSLTPTFDPNNVIPSSWNRFESCILRTVWPKSKCKKTEGSDFTSEHHCCYKNTNVLAKIMNFEPPIVSLYCKGQSFWKPHPPQNFYWTQVRSLSCLVTPSVLNIFQVGYVRVVTRISPSF